VKKQWRPGGLQGVSRVKKQWRPGGLQGVSSVQKQWRPSGLQGVSSVQKQWRPGGLPAYILLFCGSAPQCPHKLQPRVHSLLEDLLFATFWNITSKTGVWFVGKGAVWSYVEGE
jgi:hypothetical protein